MEECFLTNFPRNSTPAAKPTAERIASKSPKLTNERIIAGGGELIFISQIEFDKFTLLMSSIDRSLAKDRKNPKDPIHIPIIWNLFNRSFKNTLAKITIRMISIGPAIRASFDAPIRFMESYHVNIPNESDKDAIRRDFQLLVNIFK